MTNKKPSMPAFFDAEIKYEISLEDLIQAVKTHTGFQDGVVDFDVSKSGRVRGATIRVKRTEIKG